MEAKTSVLGLIPSSYPYLRFAMVRFPSIGIQFINFSSRFLSLDSDVRATLSEIFPASGNAPYCTLLYDEYY